MVQLSAGLRLRPAQLVRQIIPSVAALAVLLILRQSGLSERLNLFAYDLATQWRPSPSGASTPVRIIGIDEEDLAREGPVISDGRLADAVERLDRLGARAIGIDMFCGQAVGVGWQRLRRLAASNPRLVSVTFELDGKRAIPGTPPHRQATADVYTDPQDGVVRRDLLHVTLPSHAEAVSLPMRLLQVANGQSDLHRRLKRQPAPIASLHEGAGGYLSHAGVAAPGYLQRMLPFHQPGSFPTWSLRALLDPSLPEEQQRQLRGAIVLIGVVAPSGKDRFPVPHSLGRQGERRYELPGVEIHAHRLAGLLALDAGRTIGIQAAPAGLNTLLLLLALGGGVALGEGVANLRRSFFLVAASLLLGAGTIAVGLALGVWLDGALPLMALPLMAAAAWARRGAGQQIKGVELERQGQQVRTLLDRFVSKNVAEELLDSNRPTMPQQLVNVTVLMSDLRGFSLLSEEHGPAITVNLLSNYLEEMVEVIETYGGTIDEVLGDALLVLFGAPQPRPDHAETAVACALSMQLAMARVNRRNSQQHLPELEMGIGLCTGEVLAGTVGTERRAKYGVVGAAVNLASRIEELTIGGEVLAEDSTVRAVESKMRIDASHALAVKGSTQPLRIHAIGAMAGTHNLALPKHGTQPAALAVPLEVGVTSMEGKHRQGLPCPAVVTHLGEREAWILPKEGTFSPFTNVVLSFPDLTPEAYGKVREQREGKVHILFTAMPAELKDWIRGLGANESPGTPP